MGVYDGTAKQRDYGAERHAGDAGRAHRAEASGATGALTNLVERHLLWLSGQKAAKTGGSPPSQQGGVIPACKTAGDKM